MAREKLKIVFVTGVHPSESPVASKYVEEIKPMLEKIGFEVEIVPVPEEKTINSLVKKNYAESKRTYYKDMDDLEQKTTKEIYEKYNGKNVFFIETHTDKRTVSSVPSEKLKARIAERHGGHLISIFPHRKFGNYFAIEFPAQYMPDMESEYSAERLVQSVPRENIGYFWFKSDLETTKEAKYFRTIILRKIVHNIDIVVKTQAGIYREPKGARYRQTRMPKGKREGIKFRNWRPEGAEREAYRQRMGGKPKVP
ncbi:MAG: hypothetical protein V1847_00605 [Candidatus Diapherotrites archaeon]